MSMKILQSRNSVASYQPEHVVLHTPLHGYRLSVFVLDPSFASFTTYTRKLPHQLLILLCLRHLHFVLWAGCLRALRFIVR